MTLIVSVHVSVCVCVPHLQSQSNMELKHLLDKHYQNFILLQNSLAAIQASVPVITLLDSEYCATLCTMQKECCMGYDDTCNK